MQFDIFEHSRDTMLRNDVLAALDRGDVGAARLAWTALGNEYPLDASLAPLASLIAALDRRSAGELPDHDALREARHVMIEEVEPAALRMFGEAAGTAWLGFFWRQTAQRAARLAFRADRSEDHAAPLWLRAGEWAAAADAVASIESWRRIPVPLAWMIEARIHLPGDAGGLQACWGLLAELAWLSPARFDATTRRLAEPVLDKLRKRFDSGFEGDGGVDDLALFPAWLLTDQPGLARVLGQAQASLQHEPERAMRLMLDLLSLERQGRHHDLVARRKQLRDLNPSLYSAYLKTR